MNADVTRAALWANDLTRCRRPAAVRGEYVAIEVRAGSALTAELARAMGTDELVVLDRLGRGCRAFAWAWLDEVVSWLWVSTTEEYAPPLRRMLRFPDRDCHGWGAGTAERHRGRGLFTGLLEWAAWRMAEQGMQTMWNGILDGNRPSRRAHVRAGFAPVLRLLAEHEPPPGRLRTWAVDYADERLVARARQLVGAAPAPEPNLPAEVAGR